MPADQVAQALRQISYGLYLVTSHLQGKLNGQVANTVFQVTAQPPRLALCINKGNLTHQYISESHVLAVCVLDETTPISLVGLFGFRSGRDVDKLGQVNFRTGASGSPLVVDHVLCSVEARVEEALDVGTHTLFVARVEGASVFREGRALTYDFYHKHLKGKTPKAAPTWPGARSVPSPPKEEAQDMKKYICDVCGYVYDPAAGDPESRIAAGTSFDELPDEWVCPVCGASKDQFSPK